MILENLVNNIGRLVNTYKEFNPDTIQCADEITKQRLDNKELRNQWFWTANTSLYTVEDGKSILYFSRGDTSRKVNPIFNNIDESTEQLLKTGNYRPNQKDIKSVIDSVESGETARFNLSDLKLEKYDSEFSHFEIDTAKYDKLNKEQRAFAEMVYGQGEDFEKAMEMLNDKDISTTKIYVLNPDYVKKNVKQGEAVARACWLSNFGGNSNFDAGGRDVGGTSSALRGVLKVAEGDDAKKLISLQENKLHDLLEKYIAPVTLNQAKKELTKLYQ